MTQTEVLSRMYAPGEVIFREGDSGNCMYSIESGEVEISTGYGTAEHTHLTQLREGSFFGEMGMVRGLSRSATATAGAHGAVVTTITWGTLSTYFREEPAKIVLIMQQLSRRIAELTDDYIGACGEIARLLEERAMLQERVYRLEISQREHKEHKHPAPDNPAKEAKEARKAKEAKEAEEAKKAKEEKETKETEEAKKAKKVKEAKEAEGAALEDAALRDGSEKAQSENPKGRKLEKYMEVYRRYLRERGSFADLNHISYDI